MRTIEEILDEISQDGSIKVTMEEWYAYQRHIKTFHPEYEYTSAEITIPGVEIYKPEDAVPWTGGVTIGQLSGAIQNISFTDWCTSRPILSEDMKTEITKHVQEEIVNGNIHL